MANHLTPVEMSNELGLSPEEIVRICCEESIPIFRGKIDKYLFGLTLAARTAEPQLASVAS